MNLSKWDILQGIGALASIVALAMFLWPPNGIQRLVVASLLIIGIAAVMAASVLARNAPLRPIRREKMIETGRMLILSTNRELIMLAGDMSWAPDYEAAIRQIVDAGKTVKILYPDSTAPTVRSNRDRLQLTGAELVPTLHDSGVRGMLVDPSDGREAQLWVAKRTVVGEGKKIYAAKLYGMRHDWLLIQTTCKVVEVLPRRN